MKNLLSFVMVFTVLSLVFYPDLQAQRSVPGIPPSSIYDNLPESIDFRDFPAPDKDVLRAEDEADPSPYRVAVAVPVNLGIDNAGTWTRLPDGGKVWRLSLEAEGAQALGVYYDNFWLPHGGELYLYNEDKTQILGAYTEENNNADCVFANQLVQGDRVILEYYQPADQSIEPLISISELAYNYRGTYFGTDADGKSVWCMININCSPEGDDWQDEKKGVVKQYMKIGFGYYLCSGTLINNTEQDLTPYILSAWHCGENASAADLNQWIFYFKYESVTCSGNFGPNNFTMTGCWKRAEGDYMTGSDFLLLELKSDVPSSYDPYYNGWDRTNVAADSGVSIHHPAGDIKKISTYKQTLASSPWNNNGVYSHWRAWWAETPHGTSITEGGSSGSPLFSQDGLVVGDLTGGPPDDCNNPSYSLYGKIYWSWDQMGTSASEQLKPWLDPGDYGPMRWEGTYDGNETNPNFEADVTRIQPGESVNFDDLTTGNPLEWEWTFEGGDPASYTGQNPPMVTYDDPGTYTVSLTASNTLGSNTLDSTDMIVVGGPLADFSSDNNYIMSGGTASFTDETGNDPIAWNWTFEGATPDTSSQQNPTGIQYDAQGTYDVTLVAANAYGSDSITKKDFVTVDGPFAEFTADETQVLEGGTVNFSDLSVNDPDSWTWKFFGGMPMSYSGQTPPPVTYNSTGTYNVKLTVSNDLGTHSITKVDYIKVGNVGVGENPLQENLKVYPNPSAGTFTVETASEDNAGLQISVFNAKGEVVYRNDHSGAGSKVTIDISKQPAGLYMLRIESGSDRASRMLSIME